MRRSCPRSTSLDDICESILRTYTLVVIRASFQTLNLESGRNTVRQTSSERNKPQEMDIDLSCLCRTINYRLILGASRTRVFGRHN